MRWVAAASAASVCFSAAACGTFVPLRDAGGAVEYLYAWPGAAKLTLVSIAVIVTIAAAFLAVSYAARRASPEVAARARTGRWLSPLVLLGLVPLGLAPAIPGAAEWTTPLSYFLYDLRWWWFGLLVLLALSRADLLTGERLRRTLTTLSAWPVARRRRALELLLFAAAAAWATLTTPHMRFTGELHGDEPKYIRYCELWYQGGGFDISAKKLIADLAAGAAPATHRIPALIARSIAADARALVADLRAFISAPRTFKWNRAHGEEGFVSGLRGGMYQIYQPGVSFLLFPGYAIDRYRGGAIGYQGEFPASLVMTNLTMLLLYAACAVALFRLLSRALASDALGAAWAAAGMITLPAAAFAFQFYPELPGLLTITLLTTFVLFTARPGSRPHLATVVAAGAGAAYLAWLHPRFLVVSAVFALCGVIRTRGRDRLAFAAAAGVVYLTVLAFNYHVTGSFMPTSLWDAARPDEGFAARSVPLNLLGYALDRTWGLTPHAPLLLAVLPGLLLLARASMSNAIVLSAIVLALVVPASGHTLSAAGGTPGRLVVAVVPLLVWPVAVAVRRFWSSLAVRTCAAIAIVLSLEAALSYNWMHQKALGAMHAAGLSGWRPNLAFPLVRDLGFESPSNFALFTGFVVSIVALTVVAFIRANHGVEDRSASIRVPGLARAAIVAAIVVGVSTAATAVNRDWEYGDYMLDRIESRRAAAQALLSLDRCRLCFTSRDAAINWTELEPNPARGIRSHVEPDKSAVRVFLGIESDGPWPAFGRMRVDFGDQVVTPWTGVVGDWHLTHEYQQAGDYTMTIWLQLRDGTMRVERRTVRVP